MATDEFYMKRCLMLAKSSMIHVKPNPMVGCVIVHQDSIIGEGYHTKYGNPHAEVEAIQSVLDKNLLKEATLFVSLEPCAHYGKTPPCASLIIEHQIPKVVIAVPDPNPIVRGKGIQALIKAGIQVKSNVCEKEAKVLNKRFFTYFSKKRPYVILKWAQTKDGYIDILRNDVSPQINWISNKYSKQLVHKWRAEESGILIGTKTALADNPELTTREWAGNNPVRFLIDKNLSVPQDYKILNSSSKTYVYCNKSANIPKKSLPNIHYITIDFSSDIIPQIYAHMFSINLTSIIIEGGKETLEEFIKSNTWDEARVVEGNKLFYNGVSAPEISMHPKHIQVLSDDTIFYYNNISPI